LNNNTKKLEVQELRKLYRRVEQRILILMGLSLPIFGLIYLYYNSGNLHWQLPQLPIFIEIMLGILALVLLVIQYTFFQRKLKLTFQKEDLMDKLRIYAEAALQRFYILFSLSLLCSLGLLLFANPLFVLLFAINLVFFSLAKPTPDRLSRWMKLSKVNGDLIRAASRPE